MFIPALIWKVLEWFYYTVIKGTKVPEKEEVACPLAGQKGNADDCPGAKAKKIEDDIVEDAVDTTKTSDSAKTTTRVNQSKS